MANLEAFKSRIRGGLRPNQFRAEITSGPFAGQLALVPFLCHASSLPGSTIGTAPVYHRGRLIPLAGERTFAPWGVTIYADQAMSVRSIFEQWSDTINVYADNSGETDPYNYKGEALVTQLDRNDGDGSNGVKQYKIFGIFPIEISEIQLSWAQNDVVEEFTVQFAVERVDPFVTAGV